MEYTKIIPGYRTDHSAIVFSCSASPANRGKGYWKFNSKLLRDSNYIDIVKTCNRDTLSEYYSGGNIDDFLHVELLCNDQVFFWNIENENQKCFHSLQYKKILKWKGKNIKTWEWHTNFRKSNEFEFYRVYSGIFESGKGEIRKSEAGYSRGFTSSIGMRMGKDALNIFVN